MDDPMRFDEGTYEAEGQPPIIVVGGNGLPNGMHGPWVRWRFPWEALEEATTSDVSAFAEMVSVAGYARKIGEEPR